MVRPLRLNAAYGAVVHDHFDGSAHCVECGGDCMLKGSDFLATQLVRHLCEQAAVNDEPLVDYAANILRHAGLDVGAIMRRAVETNPSWSSRRKQ